LLDGGISTLGISIGSAGGIQVSASALLTVRALKKYFPLKAGWFTYKKRWIHAVDGISFEIQKGEILGLVGESGSGKSTTARLILRLMEPTAGSISYQGEDLLAIDSKKLKSLRREIQMIFQDPYASLNPRMKIGTILEEPFMIHRLGTLKERKLAVLELLEIVGLGSDALKRYPHEFSGGQRQRIGIARALATQPKLVVADEPVSSLDVSIQAQIINLLKDLQEEYRLSLLLIAHDLNLVRYLCDRVAVMYLGRIVETAPTQGLFSNPLHPYTQALLSAIPVLDPFKRQARIVLEGEPPSPIDLPKGCRFYPRCPKRIPDCQRQDPSLVEIRKDHAVACILAESP
jgi:oligopeptide transport system ATP-binding protein